ncbi:type IV toxin-antitoxin system AbiEi family antitoxin [Hymenobacter volaticus]|uniref:Type IV toxin-antitoxin system AbiEi family antitoxin n=1 Tax=Hymenobacter volaticus TaxID=2932254 RepID=A0ABY4GFA0_9BACT|nr:type IV toxin-antitoxin system AbiEi family antitoxin [Hymenobacter volaticus]UOQ69169.1 type IV toxin-antitoxin system AbiEi family antitoxin [Hymenobacter volaticus]
MGGEPAAHLLLAGYLQPEFFTLYSLATRPALMRQLGLVPDPTGNVEVRVPFTQTLPAAPAAPNCVPPLLVYADLILSGDARNHEVADQFYARYLQHPA